MPNINDDIADAYIAHSVNVLRVTESMRGDVLNLLNGLQEEMRVGLITADLGNARDKQARMKNVMKEANGSIASTYADVDGYLSDQLLELADISGKGMKRIFKEVFNEEIETTSLTRKTLEKLVDNTMIQGAASKDWWAKQSADLQGRFANQIRMGMAAGETNDQLVNRLIGRYTGKKTPVTNVKGKTKMVNEYSGGVMAASRSQATALVRTAAQTVSNSVQEATFDENEDVLNGKQLLVTLDARTSPVCMARSGAAWDFKGKPLASSSVKIDYPGPPPYHFNCRSILIPITKSWEELIKDAGGTPPPGLQELGHSTQASMDGQVAGDINYEQWLKTKPEAFQKEVLGNAKHALWKDGKLSLSEMVDHSGRPLTITQLKARLAQPPLPVVIPPPPPPPVVPPPPPPPKVKPLPAPTPKATEVKAAPPPVVAPAPPPPPTLTPAKKIVDDLLATVTGRGGVDIPALDAKMKALGTIINTSQKPDEVAIAYKEWKDLQTKRRIASGGGFTDNKKLIWETLEQSRGKDEAKIDYSKGSGKGLTTTMIARRDEAVTFLKRITSATTAPKLEGEVVKKTGRAYYDNATGGVHMDPYNEVKTYIHEMAHGIEKQNPRVLQSAQDFLNRRTKGEKPKKLKHLTGLNYRNDEIAKEDKFLEPYMGKLYGKPVSWGFNASSGEWRVKNTELVSMGLEMLYTDPQKLLETDRDMFEWLIDLLRGNF